MDITELVQHVHRKLDCTIGSALTSGICVSSRYYNICTPRANSGDGEHYIWAYPQHGKWLTILSPGTQCHFTDLIIVGKKMFCDRQWYEAARYLMIPKEYQSISIESISNGALGKSRRGASNIEDSFQQIGKSLKLKYNIF